MKAAADIDDYLSKLPAEQRAALEILRGQILAAAPGAEECISYGLPTFKLNGSLVHFGAAKSHCAFYPHGVVEHFADRLTAYDISKGTIRFQPDSPLPEALIREIVEYRVAQNAEIVAERSAKRARR
jgi:uncharacterized protein YdhG (YjbR/CyaY superfamily)